MNLKDRIATEAQQAIDDHVFPGCVIGIVYKDGTGSILPFGHFTYQQSSSRVKEDSMYDVASITKSIPTGSIALQLIDQGKLHVTDKLIEYVPEFRNSDRERVLIKHLLTYTLDGYGLASLKEKSADQLFEILLTHDFEKRPGTVFKYSNIPAALLGLVVERITGRTLDQVADECFFNPLGMERTTFYPENYLIDDIVPTERDDWRGLVHGVVHDESAYIFKRSGKIVGHAGLFSTAPDLLKFLEMLLHKGVFNGRRYLSETIITRMTENQIPLLDDTTGLGWELNQPRYMGEYAGSNTFGKTGFTGTLCVVDISRGVAYTILSNRIFPQRPPNSHSINRFRKIIGEIVLKP